VRKTANSREPSVSVMKSVESPKMPRSRRPFLLLPAEIPRRLRIPLDTGHGSFCHRQLLVNDEASDRRGIDLRGFLLFVVDRGEVILERDDEILLPSGSACLIPPGRFTLTQVPVAPTSYIENHLYFFNSRVVTDAVGQSEAIHDLALGNSMPDPGVFVLPAFARTVRHDLSFPDGFGGILRMLLHRFPAPMTAFLRHHYYLSTTSPTTETGPT